jgi:hypothetical protein
MVGYIELRHTSGRLTKHDLYCIETSLRGLLPVDARLEVAISSADDIKTLIDLLQREILPLFLFEPIPR